MKKNILFLTTLLFTIIANAQIVDIPDANFKAYLVGNPNINTNNDSEIQVSEANAYNDDITVSNLNISDLTGIQAFTNIFSLACDNNNLTSLNISGNTSIVQLYCNDNALISLNVSNCTNLATLHCQNNQLTQLDVTTNTNLLHLYCQNNQITSLDLSNNTILNTIYCQNNLIFPMLDVSNTAWKVLDCSNNHLTGLNVKNGNNSNYEYFNATLNNLICVTVDDPNYSDANWSNFVDDFVIFSTDCSSVLTCAVDIPDINFYDYLINNPLINLNGDDIIQCYEAHIFTGTIDAGFLSIANLKGIEEFWNLTILRVNNNQLTSIDLSNNGSLTELICSTNQLPSIDISQNTLLTKFNCHSNLLTNSIDVNNNTALNYLDIRYNQISSIDLSQNLALNKLYCRDNQLLNLDISLNTNLTILNCMNNQLTSLNVKNGNNQNFTAFFASGNSNLTCITVDDPVWSTANWTNIDPTASFSSNCLTYVPDDNFEQALIDLGYDSGALDDYVPTVNIASEDFLDISSNNIFDLTGIEGFSSLQVLHCYDNQITDLDMSGNPALTSLLIISNTLQTIDVSSNLNLTELFLDLNQLTDIDVSSNVNLTRLSVSGNQLTSLNVKNGNNTNFISFDARNNTNLTCISVDNPSWSTTNWTNIDATASFGQNCISGIAMTYVPDDNFEQELINLGYDTAPLDDYVPTANINTITSLNVSSKNIADLTGIEDFTALITLNCDTNNLSVLNVSNLNNLQFLYCSHNILSNIDVSQNTNLKRLYCGYNNLSNLDLSQNLNLLRLSCYSNQIVNLDVSLNTLLESLKCQSNQLTSLNVKNGNNTNFINFIAYNNASLDCINVDDAAYSTTNWTDVDAQSVFNEDCYTLTYVPDDNFEQKLINLGYDTVLDDYVYTYKINTVSLLNIYSLNIADLTGIEDFIALETLNCSFNNISSLDLSNNTMLTFYNIRYNQLTDLNVKNGNNLNVTFFDATNNPNLTCILVDNAVYSTTNWTNIDAQTTFNDVQCAPLGMTYVPDNNFEQALIDLGYDTAPLDNYVPTANIDTVTALDVHTKNIADLTGIEAFTALQYLNCVGNTLNLLDVSNNTALVTLLCDNNNLSALDVSHNLSLSQLSCGFNVITSLDLSTNTALTSVKCFYNQLTTFNVNNGNNTAIPNTEFNALSNPNLTCVLVDDANWSTTNWTNIDAQTSFSDVQCAPPGMTYVPDDNFEQALIDLGYDTAPLDNYVPTANIDTVTALDVSNKNIADLTGIEDFTALTVLKCFNNQLIDIDISNNTNLIEFFCYSNQLTSIDISNNVALKKFSCGSNLLTSVDVSSNTALTTLYCYSNNLSSLDVSNNTALIDLYCFSNNLSSLDLSNNTTLTTLSCSDNNLVSLDVNINTALTGLYCSSNYLSSLDVSNNTALYALSCSFNNLSSLDVSSNTALTYLYCRVNNLDSLDVSSNTALTTLKCSSNSLNSLDVSNNTALTTLKCSNINLSSLDVTKNTALVELICYNNQIKCLDLTNNNALIKVRFFNNNLTYVNLDNGNNGIITDYDFTNNPNLTCVNVSDSAVMQPNGTTFLLDAQTSVNQNCYPETIWNGTSWSNGVPDNTKTAIINSDYETAFDGGSFESADLVIDTAVTLTVSQGDYIKNKFAFTNLGEIYVSNQGSFVQCEDCGSINGNGLFTVEKHTNPLTDVSRFTYWSSPVKDNVMSNVFSYASPNHFYSFDQNTQAWQNIPSSTVMSKAIGYIASPSSSQVFPVEANVNFQGEPHNGDIKIPAVYNAGGTDDDNNLIGNPYPSTINANTFFATNPNVDALYFWTPNSPYVNGSYTGDDYATYTLTGGTAASSGGTIKSKYIASCQGFFAVTNATGDITFNNAMRVTGFNDDFRRPAENNNDKIWVNMYNDDGVFNQILVAFMPNTTAGYDTSYDALKFYSGNPLMFYSLGENQEKYAINAKELLQDEQIIPLGFTVEDAGIQTLKIGIGQLENLDNVSIYLKDNLLHTIYDLRLNDYTFQMNQIGSFDNRFELVFNRSALATPNTTLTNNLIIANTDSNSILVKTTDLKVIKQIKVYNVIGAEVINVTPNRVQKELKNSTLKTGTVLFFKVLLESGEIIQQKFIKL